MCVTGLTYHALSRVRITAVTEGPRPSASAAGRVPEWHAGLIKFQSCVHDPQPSAAAALRGMGRDGAELL